MICPIDQVEFTPERPTKKYCSENCRIKAFREKNDTLRKEESLDELEKYLMSEQYSKDCAALAARFNKTTWGGVTRNGYTYYTTPSGVTISISLDRKST